MKSPDRDIAYLDDILEAIELIHSYMKNISEDSFAVNLEKQDAVLSRIQIIGEAVKKISEYELKMGGIPVRGRFSNMMLR